MKTLIILRHGASEPKNDSTLDIGRKLTPEGVENVTKKSTLLKNKHVSIDAFIASSAERARQTAYIIAKALAFPIKDIVFEKILYTASDWLTVLRLIQENDDCIESILMVGHNPLCEELIKAIYPEFRGVLPAGGLIGISLPIANWRDCQPGKGILLFSL